MLKSVKQTKYLTIEQDETTHLYTILNKEGKAIASEVNNYHAAYTGHSVFQKNGKESLIDEKVNPMKEAQNVDTIGSVNAESYTVYQNSLSHEYTKPREKVAQACCDIGLALTTLAVIYGLAGYLYNRYTEQKELDKMPATYLGNIENYALFDTDSNSSTAEVAANPIRVSNFKAAIQTYNLGPQKGQTRLIAEWKKQGFSDFNYIQKDNQKSR